MHANLNVLLMPEFDLIMGMDMLVIYRATIDCQVRIVKVRTPDGEIFTFEVTQFQSLP